MKILINLGSEKTVSYINIFKLSNQYFNELNCLNEECLADKTSPCCSWVGWVRIHPDSTSLLKDECLADKTSPFGSWVIWVRIHPDNTPLLTVTTNTYYTLIRVMNETGWSLKSLMTQLGASLEVETLSSTWKKTCWSSSR